MIIYGPTATGKTALALQLARKFQGEIISADSRQVYKGLDIGTGKVSFESKIEKHRDYWIVDGVKIHGFDLVDPPVDEPGSGKGRFSAADFLKIATTSVIQITEVDKLPIIVGGTGFYIKALLEGVESIGIGPDWELRHKLEKLSAGDLYQKLLKVDPDRAKSMNESDCQNPRRLIRAIEIAMYNHKPETINNKRKIENCLIIGLTAPNPYLYSRVDKWLDSRLEHGLTDEVRRLLDQKVSPRWLDDLGLEYRWVSRYLKNKIGYSQMIERLKGDIHSFVRRQKTWFNKLKNIKLIDISKPNWQDKIDSHGHSPLFSLSSHRGKEAKASPSARSWSSLARNRKNY